MRWTLPLLLLLLPHAQAMEVQLEAPGERVEVDEPWDLEAEVTVPCMDLLSRPPAGLGHTVRFVLEHEAGVRFDGELEVPVDDGACPTDPEATAVARATFQGTASMDARGEWPLPIVATVVLDGDEETATTAESAVEVAWNGSVTVVVEDAEQTAGPQKLIEYHVRVTNHANARTLVHFELLTRPAEKASAVVPDEVVLDPAGDHASLTVVLTYSTPFKNGPNRVDDAVVLQVVPGSMDGSRTGPASEHALIAHTRGQYVPGPGVAPLLLALGALLAARRR